MGIIDYIPGASNVKGLVTGNYKEALTGPLNAWTGGESDKLLDAAGNVIRPAQADLSGVKAAQTKAFGVTDALGAERAGLAGQNAQLYGQGQGAIGLLQDAANGLTPSAAELQLREQATKNASQAFGLSAALQGRSPGMALRQAQIGAAQTQGQTNADAATLRANEMAQARGQLVGAVQGQQGNTTTQGGQLLGGQVGALNAGTTAAGNAATASAANAGAQNTYKGGLIGTAAGLLASDEREKTDVHPANLDALAEALKGFTFKYQDPSAPGASGGERVGVMAQDVEKGGPAGKAMVRGLPDGHKGLDAGNMVGAALAMAAEALKRTRGARAA